MIKRIKLLSLVSLVVATAGLRAEYDGALIDPAKFVGAFGSILRKPHTGCFLGAAVVASMFADDMSKREYDDKGAYKTISTSEVDPMVTDAVYCLAEGAGYAAVNQWLCEKEDMSIKQGVSNSLVSAAALFVVEQAKNMGMFRSLNRNNALFRWVPWSVKCDEAVAKSVLCIVATRLFNQMVAPVVTGSAPAPSAS